MTMPNPTDAARIAAGLNDLQIAACLAGEGWYPRCRECGDEGGTCPYWHDWPCDITERQPFEDAIRAHLGEKQ